MKKGKENRKQLRERVIRESEIEAKKQRLGLFSMPVPLTIGSETFKAKKAKLDEDGKVITQKRGIYTRNENRNKNPIDLFDGTVLLTDGKYKDPYFKTIQVFRDSGKTLTLKEKKALMKDGAEEEEENKVPFYLATTKWAEYGKAGSRRIGAPYENKPQNPIKKRKKIKDEDGRVIIGEIFLTEKFFTNSLSLRNIFL